MKAIAAMTRDRVIGDGGRIPWHLPEDFKWFKSCTLGGTVVMGSTTAASLGKPLPGRENIVLSRDPAKGSTIPEVCQSLRGDHVWVIGGAQIYKELLPYCSELYLTVIEDRWSGDVIMPKFEHIFKYKPDIVHEHVGFVVKRYRNPYPLAL